MDAGAKAHWQFRRQVPTPPQITINGEMWSLWVGAKKVSSNIFETVNDVVSGQRCRTYWEEHDQFLALDSMAIEWDAVDHAMRNSKWSRQRWVTKHSSGHCGVGVCMKRWKKWSTDNCPRCSATEDALHVLTCQGKDASVRWEQSIASVRMWCLNNRTCPEITDAICAALQAWRVGDEPPDMQFTFPGLAEAYHRQTQAGWACLLQGFPVVGWAEVQHAYLVWMGSRTTGKRWLSALIRKLWDVSWDQWEHRNGILHDIEDDQRSRLLDARIRHQYSLGSDDLLAPERRLLRRVTLEEILRSSVSYRESWIARMEAARNHSARARRRRERPYAQERRQLAAWLSQGAATQG